MNKFLPAELWRRPFATRDPLKTLIYFSGRTESHIGPPPTSTTTFIVKTTHRNRSFATSVTFLWLDSNRRVCVCSWRRRKRKNKITSAYIRSKARGREKKNKNSFLRKVMHWDTLSLSHSANVNYWGERRGARILLAVLEQARWKIKGVSCEGRERARIKIDSSLTAAVVWLLIKWNISKPHWQKKCTRQCEKTIDPARPKCNRCECQR